MVNGRPTETEPGGGSEKRDGLDAGASFRVAAPQVSLPKGGGSIRGIGETFAASPLTGTAGLSIPIATSPARSGFQPELTLSYDSGSGNGVFGLGWSLGLPRITRKTSRGIPTYRDADESDVFVLSGAEDLVPELVHDGGQWSRVTHERSVDGARFRVDAYRPRVEGPFARIERWTELSSGASHWRSISRDDVTTLYGRTAASRIADPDDPARVFSWLVCESFDDRGNAIVYEYKPEDSTGVELGRVHERNRTAAGRSANRYPKRVLYGNRVSRLVDPTLAQPGWMFEVVLDYGEHAPDDPRPDDAGAWLARRDPFSTHRGGFELRTYRLCQRVLVFHHFPDQPGVGERCLVRSTDLAYRDLRGDPEDRRRGHPIASFLAAVVQAGYRRRPGGGYPLRGLPPLALDYRVPAVDREVRELDRGSLEDLPRGIDEAR
jgi:hypothetical protein